MKPNPILFSLLICISISSACIAQQDEREAAYGEVVFYQIFPSLLDSIEFDMRLIPPPPPPPEHLVDTTEDPEEWSREEAFKLYARAWEKRKDSIEQDTTTIYLTMPDSVKGTEENDVEELIRHFGKHAIPGDSVIISEDFPLELSRLETNQKKVRFIYRSSLPGKGDFWRTDYGKYIAAGLGFSKIIFDKTKSYGVLNASCAWAPLNGTGIRIFIRKGEDGKWIIDKMVGTWIS